MNSLKEGLQEESKLAQHAYEKGDRVDWDEAKILETERNETYKELTHVVCLTNLHPSRLDSSLIWIPLISTEVASQILVPGVQFLFWCVGVLENAINITGDVKDSYKELKHVLSKFPNHHVKILLGEFSTKLGRENIFKPTTGMEV
jgi:hypothetical protein